MKHLTIFADATPTMGTGHVMRCLALAQWAKKLSIPCMFMGRIHVPWVEARLAKECIDFISLSGEIPKEEEPENLLKNLAHVPQGSWVVLDGYHFTLECQKAVRAGGYKLLVIDDYAHLPEYSCDILLNQNIGAQKLVYSGEIVQKCLGLEYVLLRQEFIRAGEQAKHRTYPKTPQNILITLGGGNFIQYLKHMTQYFAIESMQDKTLRIIAGSMQADDILNAFKDCPAKIKISHNVCDMPALLLDTDLCISAGGSTCWELCCLNVPFLTVEIAENQRDIVVELDKHNIAPALERRSFEKVLSTEEYTKLVKKIQNSPIDGQSMQRIIGFMQKNNTSHSKLRKAKIRDKEFVFKLANDPRVREASFSENTITWEEHSAWYDNQLEKDYPFYIIEQEGEACGYIRFQPKSNDTKIMVLSIAVQNMNRHAGLGLFSVQEACRQILLLPEVYGIVALVKCKNKASIKLFQKACFTLTKSSHDSLEFFYP